MLIIRRRAGEAIAIGDDIEIEIVELGASKVKVGIRAPRHVTVQRKEMSSLPERNLAAAALPPGIRNLIARRICAESFPQTPCAAADKTFEARYTGHPEPKENPGPA